MKQLPLYLSVCILLFAGCQRPPEKMSTSNFFILLRNGQIDKVVIVNEKQAEFTIKNSKQYPMGKWYLLPPLTDAKAFAAQMEKEQAHLAHDKRVLIIYETRVKFLKDAFNYLLPLVVLGGLVAGFFMLRRNR